MKNILKKYNKIIAIIIMFLILFVCSNKIYATDSIIEGADFFLEQGVDATLNSESMKTTSDLIYNILLAVGTVIVIVVGAVLGIQFMIGSVAEKAKVQEALIPFIVGSVVVFGSFAIWKVVTIALVGI